MDNAKLTLNGNEYEFPVVVGSEGEVGIDFAKLRSATGAVALDPGYGNVGSCQSAITFIDGEKGILRYRGYPIEELANNSTFEEAAYLVIFGELPNQEQLEKFRYDLSYHSLVHENIRHFLDGYPQGAHPMAVLSSAIIAMSSYYEHRTDPEGLYLNIIRLISKAKTLAAFAYKHTMGHPFVYPRNDQDYAEAFLHMMFALPTESYTVSETLKKAVNLLLILHLDHEQNCSASTVRMVGSSQVNLFAAMGAGVCALWGPLHGGANQEVLEMLQQIHEDGGDYRKYVDMAKDKDNPFRLMGFGHRVYKNFDPRASIIKGAADEVLKEMGVNDPLLEIAKHLEEVALHDEYFVQRNLYPNVDFYSGIIYRAMGIPLNMFTVMFALGRLPGWVAQWKEMIEDPATRINRPRQIYTGAVERHYQSVEQR